MLELDWLNENDRAEVMRLLLYKFVTEDANSQADAQGEIR